MNKTPLFVAAALGLAASAVVLADDQPEPPAPPAFGDVDTDGDQMITQDELKTFMQERRAERKELRARKGWHQGQGDRPDPFARADTDGDGVLNQQEFEQMTEKMQQMREHMRNRWKARKSNDSTT